MNLKAKFGAFIAAAVVVFAIGSASAQAAPAAPAIPTSAELSALCAKSGNAKIKSACAKAVSVYDGCSAQTSSKGLASCLAASAKSIIGSGVPTSGSSKDIISKLKSLIGGSTGGLSIGGFDISTILSKLGGAGGFSLSGLLGKLGG